MWFQRNLAYRASVITIAVAQFVANMLLAVGDDKIENVPSPAKEFRAAWIATVANIDWPSERGLSTAKQQAELITLFDTAVHLNLNAIILQVRPSCDALYASEIDYLGVSRSTRDFGVTRMGICQQWRAGIEGTVSRLKRAFRLVRCGFRGFKHFASAVDSAVFCHNLRILAKTSGG